MISFLALAVMLTKKEYNKFIGFLSLQNTIQPLSIKYETSTLIQSEKGDSKLIYLLNRVY